MVKFNNIENIPNNNVTIQPQPENVAEGVSPSSTLVPLVSDSSDASSSVNNISEEGRAKLEERAKKAREERSRVNEQDVQEMSELKNQASAHEKNVQYMQIIFSKDKPKNKLFKAVDLYLSGNDENYKNITSQVEKQKYILSFINNISQKINGKSIDKISPIDFIDLLSLTAIADAQGLSVKDIESKNQKELKDIVSAAQTEQLQEIIKNIDKNNPEKSMYALADKILTLSADKEYANITNEAEKQKYIDKKIDELLTKQFGISGWNAPGVDRGNLFKIVTTLIQKIACEEGVQGLKDFRELSEYDKTKKIIDVIGTINDLKNDSEINKFVKNLRLELRLMDQCREYNDWGNDHKVTTKEYYDYLSKMYNKGKLNCQEEKIYRYYEALIKNGYINKDELANEPKLVGNYMQALLKGQTVEALFQDKMNGITAENIHDDKSKGIIIGLILGTTNTAYADVNQVHILVDILVKNGIFKTKEEAIKYLKAECGLALDRVGVGATVVGLNNGDVNSAVDATNFVSDWCSEPANNHVGQIIEDQAANALGEAGSAQLLSQMNSAFLPNMVVSVNNTFDPDTAANVFTNAITNNNTSEERKSSIVQLSYSTTGDVARAARYTESYKKINDPTVTEAMAAAAHNASNDEIRKIIDEGVGYAVKNNGYSSDEVQRVQQARESGEVSVNENLSNSSSLNSPTQKQSVSGKSSASSSYSSAGPSVTAASKPQNSSNSNSSNNSSISNNNSNNLNNNSVYVYEQVTRALELRKEEALKQLEKIVENYQKSIQERETRLAQQTLENSSHSANSDNNVSSINQNSQAVQGVSPVNTDENIDETAQVQELVSEISNNFVADIKSSLTEEQIQALNSAESDAVVYQILGTINSNYQAKFLDNFALHASSAALCSFASDHIGDKALLRKLFDKSQDPALLQYLGESIAFELLEKGKIKLKDFLRFASADMIAKYLRQMKQEGNTSAIRAITDLLSLEQGEQLADLSADINENNARGAKTNEPPRGSDEWLKTQQKMMSGASSKIEQGNPDNGLLSLNNPDLEWKI